MNELVLKFVLQEVKHWIDPRIIPFGWGTFDSGQFVDPQTKDVNCIILPIVPLLSADRDRENTQHGARGSGDLGQ